MLEVQHYTFLVSCLIVPEKSRLKYLKMVRPQNNLYVVKSLLCTG